jgi:hypothetical protein
MELVSMELSGDFLVFKNMLAVSLLVMGFGTFKTETAAAAVPTADVCRSFAAHAIRWNTRARSFGCPLPRHDNMHFDERAIYQWCMSRPNDDRSPQALGHKSILEKHCRRGL